MTVQELVKELGRVLDDRRLCLATAESCTGGWVAKEITTIPGCSHWFERGFVTYTNLAKQEMLGVQADTLERHGAVSEQTVREMAEGALRRSNAQVTLSISGIAGPDGGTPEKPVGTVWLGWAGETFPTTAQHRLYSGGREDIRLQSVEDSLRGLLELLETYT